MRGVIEELREHPGFRDILTKWANRLDIPGEVRAEIEDYLSHDEDDDIPAINWNEIEDDVDLKTWNRLNTNVWWPEKVAISKDIPTWEPFPDAEKLLTRRVFTGLTALDTYQARIGASMVSNYALTTHEKPVMNQIAYMEDVHARSYSSIFSTLCSSAEIKEAYRWSRENEFLKIKKAIIRRAYYSGDGLKVRIASVMLESFLFYSGFYLPLYYSSEGRLTNTGDIIKLIIR